MFLTPKKFVKLHCPTSLEDYYLYLNEEEAACMKLKEKQLSRAELRDVNARLMKVQALRSNDAHITQAYKQRQDRLARDDPTALAQGVSPKLGKSRHRRRQKAILAKVRVTSRASFSGNTGKLLQPVYASARWAPTDGSADFGHNLCLRNSPAALAQGVSPKLGKSRHRRRRKAFLAKVRVTSRNFSGNTGRGGGRSMPDRLQELATLDRLQAGPQGVVTPDVSAADLALQAPAAAGLANRCAKLESIIVTRVMAVGCGSLHDRKVREHERMLRNFETGFER
ncbi:hypothetical protein HDU89_008351 [Geranomyces variabilis]|nr:hypothetical protein HDU89_008351 [Geranomyces variabilis]